MREGASSAVGGRWRSRRATAFTVTPEKNLIALEGGGFRPLSPVCWAELPLPPGPGFWEFRFKVSPVGRVVGATIVIECGSDEPPLVVPLPPLTGELVSLVPVPREATKLRVEIRSPFGPFDMAVTARPRRRVRALTTFVRSIARGEWSHGLAVRRRGLLRAAWRGDGPTLRLLSRYAWEAYRDRESPPDVAQEPVAYQDWLKVWTQERPEPGPSEEPMVAFVVPNLSRRGQMLEHTLESLRRQSCGAWSATLTTGDAATDSFADIVGTDERIELVRSPDDSLAGALVAALERSNAPLAAVLRVGDEVDPLCVEALKDSLEADPTVGVVIADEDEIGTDGRRSDPWLKVDWDPDRVRCSNVFGRALFCSRTRLLGVATSDPTLNDTDLLARAALLETANCPPLHIPLTLVHCRRHLGEDPAPSAESRSSWGKDLGVARYIEGRVPGHLIAVPERVDDPPSVSVIIPTRDRLDVLRVAVEGVLHETKHPAELVVVDNATTDPETLAYLERVEAHPSVTVLRDPGPFNFSRLNNLGAERATGEVLVLLNNDIEVIDGTWLSFLAAHAVRPGVGAVGARLLYPDGTIQHAGVRLGVRGIAAHCYVGAPRDHAGDRHRILDCQTYSAVTAACLAVRRDSYFAVGGLDEDFEVAFNDVDFCLRLRDLGLRNIYVPDVVLYHHESISRGREDSPEKVERIRREQLRMIARWGDQLITDPYHSPNETLRGDGSGLAAFPRSCVPGLTNGVPASRRWREVLEYPA